MRITPMLNNFNSPAKNNSSQTRFVRKNSQYSPEAAVHQYSGVASADLAYASMFDSAIARDLKLMGLI